VRGSLWWKELVFIKKARGVAPGAVVKVLVCCSGRGRKERVATTFYGFMLMSEREHLVKVAYLDTAEPPEPEARSRGKATELRARGLCEGQKA
jgi:hypothetical protein